MKIRRQRNPDRFTVLDNAVLEDRRLPYRALGVLAFLLSRPDGWETDSEDLAHNATNPADAREGRDAVRTALRVLKDIGYLDRRKVQDPKTGHWSTVSVVIDRAPTPENPSSAPTPKKPTVGYLDVGKSGAKNPSTDPNHGTKALGVDVDLSPPPVLTGPRPARPEEAVENLNELCAELRVLRRDDGLPLTRWTDANIRRAIARCLDVGYPATAVPDAFRALARDPSTQTPGRAPHDGPWWTAVEADELRRRKLERAAAARQAATEHARARQAGCDRCHGSGEFTNFTGRQVRCDHIPDVEDTA